MIAVRARVAFPSLFVRFHLCARTLRAFGRVGASGSARACERAGVLRVRVCVCVRVRACVRVFARYLMYIPLRDLRERRRGWDGGRVRE